MKTKHNLFAVVEKDTNRAVSIIESGLVPFFESRMSVLIENKELLKYYSSLT